MYNEYEYFGEEAIKMAFSDLAAVTAADDRGGCTYIIGSVFAVYKIGNTVPVVYSWDMMKSVSVTRRGILVTTVDSSYQISGKMFTTIEDSLRAVAIIECKQREFGFSYQHERRLFPLKSMYRECSPGRDVYTGEGMLDEAETAAAFIMLLNFKLMKFLWLVAILIMLVTFGILQLTVGITRDNVLYFIPISVAAGAITALIINIIAHAIARVRFKALADADPASRQMLTFVVSRVGFAACESCVYDERDLVPWSEMDYFIESDKMFILYKNNQPAAYIPRRAFDKKFIGGIIDIIALNLEQR